MICAYDKIYLEKAKTSLARMLDFAVYDLEYDIDEFLTLFIESGVAKRFEMGDSSTIAGKSGVELAYEVIEKSTGTVERIQPRYTMNRSEEYWMGYALAYYQWLRVRSYADILQHVPAEKIKALYTPYHEMDLRQFADKMDELYQKSKKDTNLKIRRLESGYTQNELAEITGIPLRTIQEYEQGRKNINKAQMEYVYMLAQALCCKERDLLE